MLQIADLMALTAVWLALPVLTTWRWVTCHATRAMNIAVNAPTVMKTWSHDPMAVAQQLPVGGRRLSTAW